MSSHGILNSDVKMFSNVIISKAFASCCRIINCLFVYIFFILNHPIKYIVNEASSAIFLNKKIPFCQVDSCFCSKIFQNEPDSDPCEPGVMLFSLLVDPPE